VLNTDQSSWTRYVLCCAVLCCAVLCCAVLCCAVLCCAVLCCAEVTEVSGAGWVGLCRVLWGCVGVLLLPCPCWPPPPPHTLQSLRRYDRHCSSFPSFLPSFARIRMQLQARKSTFDSKYVSLPNTRVPVHMNMRCSHACMHTNIQTYTLICTNIHTCIHANKHTCMCRGSVMMERGGEWKPMRLQLFRLQRA
jgi:hypothetical protein